jgi:hypothetical protein
MIIDVTGIILTPGNKGDNCFGNGEHTDANGNDIECCCDECDYFLECFPEFIR